jgi:hypothetical protein
MEKFSNIPGHKGNANQNHIKIPAPVRIAVSKTPTPTNVGEDMGKKEPSYTVSGNVNQYNHYGKQDGGSSILFGYILGIYPKECDTGYLRGTCTPMFIEALFTRAKLWKQPRCPTTDEWIKKMWYLYTMEFYSAMKNNEILLFAGKKVDGTGDHLK